MKKTKNKNNKFGSPILAGYSDKRIHIATTACLMFIVFSSPLIGFGTSSFIALSIGLLVALKAAKYQSTHFRSDLLYLRMMDQIYHNGENAESYDKALNRYKSPSEIRRLRRARAYNAKSKAKSKTTKVLAFQLNS